MYSEIKSSDKILINRLDENEKILLKDIYKRGALPSAKFEMDELTDESGEFGGVMLNLISLDNKDIIVDTDIPKALTITVGDTYSLEIETNIKDETPVIYFKSSDNTAIYENLAETTGISFRALKTVEEPVKLYYTIAAEGYNTINGSIDLSIIPKETQTVVFEVYNEDNIPINDVLITVTDNDDTQYIVNEENTFNTKYVELPKGTYTVKVQPVDIETYEEYINDNYTITDEDLASPNTKLELITLQYKSDAPVNSELENNSGEENTNSEDNNSGEENTNNEDSNLEEENNSTDGE